jgi:L-ribulose-5-phosphate 4-epimerase
MLSALRHAVLDANIALFRTGLATFTFGNASGIDRDTGHVVIKPSGVPYGELRPEQLVVTDLDGTIIHGTLRPSSDLATHLALYRAFQSIGGVVHTHSHYATAFAQAGRELPCLGTTHADYFRGPVPVTDPLEGDVIRGAYEAGTGDAIVRRVGSRDPMEIPAVLVDSHAPFCWGTSVAAAVETAALLEEIARLAYHTLTLAPKTEGIETVLLDKHFLRKHGSDAYYGQA